MRTGIDSGCSGCGAGVETRRTLVVRTTADARRLLNWTRRYDSIIVVMAARDEASNRASQSRLVRDYFECGCTAGAQAMIAALAIGPFVAWWSWPYTITNTLNSVSIWFGIIFTSSLTAKSVALLKARMSLRCAIKDLDRGVLG